MRGKLFACCIAASVIVALAASPSGAAFESGSTGADGAFNPAANTALKLPASGVFNFTTVNIPAGVTVTFVKNANNTPVTILAQGNVTIAGTINVSGGSVSSTASAVPGAGGPGGFAGGYGGATNTAADQGLGPGGGYPGQANQFWIYALGGGGGYGTAGAKASNNGGAGGPAYGNERVSPLIGGSGGGGSGGTTTGAGSAAGGGGGAILIASSTSISVTGTIVANGGDGYYSGSGSGGSIKLMANSVTGNGTIAARGGTSNYNSTPGGTGRIRIEAYTVNLAAGTDPAYTYGQPGSAMLSNMPTLSIVSIAGVNVPVNPAGSFSQPDMLLPNTTTNPVTVNVSAANIPVGTAVTLSVVPRIGSATNVTATLGGTLESSSASAKVTIPTSYISVIMATATFTMRAMLDGEQIEKAVVTATPGRESETVLVTQSGRQVKVTEVIASNLKEAGNR